MIKLDYVASSGRVYNLKSPGMIRTKEANYHIWEWGIDGTELQYGTRVAAFTREAATYSTKLVLDGGYFTRKDLLEDLHDDFELDVKNKTPGRIIWGDYYIDCFITLSSTYPGDRNQWTENDVTIYCPYPFWIREKTRSFYPQEAPVGETFLDYEFDYDYDFYFGDPGIATWPTDFPFASEFKLIIFGPCSNPRILINGYPYQINDTLEGTERIEIDSRNNKVIKHLANGQAISIFDLRNKEQSVFEPIPGGTLTLNWSGAFGFDLIIFEERSEPRWEN